MLYYQRTTTVFKNRESRITEKVAQAMVLGIASNNCSAKTALIHLFPGMIHPLSSLFCIHSLYSHITWHNTNSYFIKTRATNNIWRLVKAEKSIIQPWLNSPSRHRRTYSKKNDASCGSSYTQNLWSNFALPWVLLADKFIRGLASPLWMQEKATCCKCHRPWPLPRHEETPSQVTL